jgi:hypothetical protein
MKKLFLLFFSIHCCFANAQTYKVDTLQYRGDVNKYINFVLLGDGFTAAEQGSFITQSKDFVNKFFAEEPFSAYRNYFNFFAIRSVSTESGAKHPNNLAECANVSPKVPQSNPNNLFGSTFDAFSIHRLVVATNGAKVQEVLSKHTPFFDQALILVNSPYYGGSGGAFPTSTLETNSNEISLHELGHSFAALSDEYWAGEQFARETANMTKETSTTLVKWKNWLNFRQTGIFDHEVNPIWKRPHQNCKMRFLGPSFCPVCQETIAKRIHQLTDPVVRFSPGNKSTISSQQRLLSFRLLELMKPQPNTLKIEWQLDGKTIFRNQDSIKLDQNTLSKGAHTLKAIVSDTTTNVRDAVFTSAQASVVTWAIDKTTTGLEILPDQQQILSNISPNPAQERTLVSLELEQKNEVQIVLIDAQGRVLKNIQSGKLAPGKHGFELNTSQLPRGYYQVLFQINSYRHALPLLVQKE